jgi:2'-5' RNA ligase
MKSADFRTKAVSIMNNFRLFLGLKCSADATEYMAGLIEQLSAEGISFRSWTHPSDLHVTLHFLGDTPASRMQEIGVLAAEAAAATAPFALALTEAGTFGPPSAPRVLWCGLAEPAAPGGALAALHAALGARLSASGFATEAKTFRAHVTIARGGAAGFSAAALAAAQAACSQALPAWTVNSCTLFRTHLGRKPSYEAIGEYAFKR